MDARRSRSPRTVIPADTERTKSERLRELRLASEASGREAGTWGDASVGEITHVASGATFVYYWSGRQEQDLGKLLARRLAGTTPEEYQALVEWLLQYRVQGFRLAIRNWNLSTAEARRLKQLRIAEHKAAGRSVINDTPRQG